MSHADRHLAQVEPLESRTLLSAAALAPAAPPLAVVAPVSGAPKMAAPLAVVAPLAGTVKPTTYKILDLLGINSAGASWTYGAKYSYTVDDDTENGAGIANITLPALPAGTSTNSFQVRIPGGKLKIELASNKLGTYVRVNGSMTGLGSVDVPIKLAARMPTSLALGQSYQKASAFNGSANFTLSALGNRTISGAIEGTYDTSFRLPRTGIITVAAGKFKAVRVEVDFALDGKMSATYKGKTYNAKISGKVHQVFYSVPRLGIVKGDASVEVDVSLNRLLGVSASATAHVELKASSLLSK